MEVEVYFEIEALTAISILHDRDMVVDLSSNGRSQGQFLNKYRVGKHIIEHTRSTDDGRIHEYYIHGPVDGIEEITPFMTDQECITLIKCALNIEYTEASKMFHDYANRDR